MTDTSPVELRPLSPEDAVEMYLSQREADLSKKSLQNQRYRLTRFLEWCDEAGVTNMNDLSGRKLHEYRIWRSENIKRVTLVNELRTFQKFLEFCAQLDAVEPGLREKVAIPDLKPGDEAKDDELTADRARDILSHLKRFHYASREHVIFAILWQTGIRLGALRAIDVTDYEPKHQWVWIRHRPETDTPLKNGAAAERAVNLSPYICKVLEDYITHNRIDVTDKYGRQPLISSKQGRLTAVPIRRTVYRLTQPCEIGPCPHDKDPKTCEWRDRDHLHECPSSRSPHAIRRGSITHHLRQSTPDKIVEERANVSGDVLDKHYDQRTDAEKAMARRDWLESAFTEEDWE